MKQNKSAISAFATSQLADVASGVVRPGAGLERGVPRLLGNSIPLDTSPDKTVAQKRHPRPRPKVHGQVDMGRPEPLVAPQKVKYYTLERMPLEAVINQVPNAAPPALAASQGTATTSMQSAGALEEIAKKAARNIATETTEKQTRKQTDHVSEKTPQQDDKPSSKPVADPLTLVIAFRAYLRSFDKTAELDDIVIGLPVKKEDFTAQYVPRAFKRLGLIGEVRKIPTLKDEHYPACIFLTEDRFLIVLGKVDGQYVVENPIAFEGIRKVNCECIDREYTGRAMIAAHDFDAITRKYVGEPKRGHWFWSHFATQKRLIGDIIAGSFVANILAVGVSLFTLQVYDRVIPNQSEPTLWVLVVGALIAIMLECTLRIARASLIDVSGRKIEVDISRILFQKLQGMKLSKRPAGPGSLLYSIREFSSVREFFTNTTITSAADIPFVFIFLALIYFIAGNVVWLVVGAMLLIVVPSLLYRGKMLKLTEEMLEGTSGSNKVLIEATYGQEQIKNLSAESHFQKKWEELLELISTKTTEQRILSAKLSHWASSTQQMAYIGAVTYGVYFVFAGDLSVGAIIAISILTSRTLAPVTSLSSTLAKWQQVKASLDHMSLIVDSEQDIEPSVSKIKADSLRGTFALENTAFQYSEDENVILNIAKLEIEAGKIYGILGANGSGKSTLMKLLSGLYAPTAGTITLDGMLLDQISPLDVRRHIGFLSQDVRLFTGTLRRNLEMVCGPRSDVELFKALEFAGLARYVKMHPRGLDMEIVDGGAGVSTGQRQSIGMARLYLQDPSIILLDEPTASFDQLLELKVVANLKSWIAGRTCIISTHRPAALELMDEIIILQNGRVSAKGEAKSVISKLSRPKVKSKPGGEKPSQENQAPVQPSHARSKTRMIQTAQIAPKVIGQTANGLHQAAK